MLATRPPLRKRSSNSSQALAEFQITRRRADRLIRFVPIQLRVLGTVVHDQVNNHPCPAAGTIARAEDLISLNHTPLTARAPILPEFVERILRVILRMLLPRGVVVVNAVSRFEILLLQRRK